MESGITSLKQIIQEKDTKMKLLYGKLQTKDFQMNEMLIDMKSKYDNENILKKRLDELKDSYEEMRVKLEIAENGNVYVIGAHTLNKTQSKQSCLKACL